MGTYTVYISPRVVTPSGLADIGMPAINGLPTPTAHPMEVGFQDKWEAMLFGTKHYRSCIMSNKVFARADAVTISVKEGMDTVLECLLYKEHPVCPECGNFTPYKGFKFTYGKPEDPTLLVDRQDQTIVIAIPHKMQELSCKNCEYEDNIDKFFLLLPPMEGGANIRYCSLRGPCDELVENDGAGSSDGSLATIPTVV